MFELSETCAREIGERAVRYTVYREQYEWSLAHGQTSEAVGQLDLMIQCCPIREFVPALRAQREELMLRCVREERHRKLSRLFFWLGIRSAVTR